MASLNKVYTAQELPQGGDGEFSPIPDGVYDAVITMTDVKSSKNNPANLYIEVTYTVTGPQYQNRKIFDIVNFQNASPTAQAIGSARLRAMMDSTGLSTVRDSAEFHNRRVKIKVATDAGQGEYGPKNKVTAVLPSSGAQAAAAPAHGVATGAVVQAARPKAATAAPWA